jgi:hypothetical protein
LELIGFLPEDEVGFGVADELEDAVFAFGAVGV